MNHKDENFKYLIEHACSVLRLSHQAVKEKFKDFPVCYMQNRKDGTHSDSVEVSFDRIGASITCSTDKKDVCTLSSIYFYDKKDGDLFVNYLVKNADHYSYHKKVWIVKCDFYMELKKQYNDLHFYCCKMEDEEVEIPDANNIDFAYLIEQMYMPIGKTHSQMIEEYKELPICLMECVDNGEHSEHIRVDFDKQGISITYIFNENKEVTLTSLCLPEPSDADLFITFLLRFADRYNYMKNYWVIKNRFFLTVEKEDYCTDFICRKFSG